MRSLRSNTVLAALVGCVALAALQGAAAPSKAPYQGQAANGKKLFTAKGCVACHQPDGRGGIKLTGNPTPDWRDPVRMADSTHDDAYLRDCITNGKTKSGMIAWKKQLKPEQIEDLIAHIRTFSRAAEDKKSAK
jgi:mono/diheme cytochrome c family protein